MGRHSLEDERAFWRSVMFFVLRWLAIGALPLLAIWGVWRLVSQPDDRAVAPAVVAEVSPTPAAPSPPAATTSPVPPAASPSPAISPTSTQSPSPAAKGRVQVLNGTSTSGLGRRAADKLAAASFQIDGVSNAARNYPETIVYFKPGFEALAREVGEVIGSSKIEPAPNSLTRDVPVTLVVGANYQP